MWAVRRSSTTSAISMTCAVSMPGCLSVIRQQMNRESQAGEAYIMMSKDRHTVRLYSYDKRSCRLYEQRFDKDYTFMKVSGEGDREVFSISWDDVVVLLGSPVIRILRIK